MQALSEKSKLHLLHNIATTEHLDHSKLTKNENLMANCSKTPCTLHDVISSIQFQKSRTPTVDYTITFTP